MRNAGVRGLVCWAAVLSVMVALGAQAGEKREKKKPAGPRKARVTGVVKATKNDEGDITAVTITTAKGTAVPVSLEEGKGAEMGKEMDGKKVQAVGTVAKQGDQRVLTVLEYKEPPVREKKEPRKPRKPNKPKDE